MSDILELETRRKIYDLVSRNPGLHLSKIAEILKMRTSLVEYHLLFLKKNNAIRVVKQSGYTRYYVEGSIGISDKKTLSILRQEIPLQVVIYLIKNDDSPHKDILKNVDVSPSTLSYHLKKMTDNGIIHLNEDKKNVYTLSNKEEIVKLLMNYKPFNLFDSFKDIWVDLSFD